MTEQWKAEQRTLADRDLSGVDYVYLCTDGVHVKLDQLATPTEMSDPRTTVGATSPHAQDPRGLSPVTDSINRSTAQDLADLHWQLDRHFRQLRERRAQLPSAAPVFALEHGLDDAEREALQEAVRSAVRQGFGLAFRKWWLPFVVYAAESGYEYAGSEYWQTFEESTPQWRENGERDDIRVFFQRFAEVYGGARPQGAFAKNFGIIAWPTTHAVLPAYLQHHLAHLLYDFRTGLTAALLQNPGDLGERLAARTGAYTERFRYFCQNTNLVGQVSVALLSGEEDESPYLLRSTLHRLVAGLSRERQSQLWLRTAQQAAGQIRANARGFVPKSQKPRPQPRLERLPRPTDPRLLLRLGQSGWQAYAELPDLSSLVMRMPHVSGELRNRRPKVAGAERLYLARGSLLRPGLEVRLARWPGPGEPFISLERAENLVNQLIAEQCAVTRGPAWLFHRRASGLAVEVKGKVMHPGSSYVLVTESKAAIPLLPGMTEIKIETDGVRAFEIAVPEVVNESHTAAFAKAGLSLVVNVTIKPIGIVPSVWDGEGSVEWLAGEPGMIGIYAEQIPVTCVVTVDGQSQALPWPGEQRDLLLRLDDLGVGTSRVSVALISESDRTFAEGSLVVAIRDPQVRPDSATAGEGIRLLADPAQPMLSDLWDGRARISIDGPSSTSAKLAITMLSDTGEKLAEIEHKVDLPVSPENWSGIVEEIRKNQRFQKHYDNAQSARIAVSRYGIGFAALTCDRGFQPLRWRVMRRRNGGHLAHLIDRTDGAQVKVEIFTVDNPLVPVPCSPSDDIAVPPRGGLLRATAGETTATSLLPTQPNEIMKLGKVTPDVKGTNRSSGEVMRLAAAHLAWATAERPADPFASNQCEMVLGAITKEISSGIGGRYWASVERKVMAHATSPMDFLDEMEACVGNISTHRKLAHQIACSLWSWSTPDALLAGLTDALTGIMQDGKAKENQNILRFVLTLADQPGQILIGWQPSEREAMLAKVITSPVLLRAARFALLGARAYDGAITVGGPW